jgi:hypothetical protein
MSRRAKPLREIPWKPLSDSLQRAYEDIERPRTRYMNNTMAPTPRAGGNGAGMAQEQR